MAIFTLVVAIVGVVTGVASLVWQAVSWTYEGPKVKVRLATSFPVVTGSQLGDPHYSVTAVNIGRSPVLLNGWGFELPGGDSVVDLSGDAGAIRLPWTLEGGHEAQFFMSYSRLHGTLEVHHPNGVKVRPFVSTATAGRRYAKAFDPLKGWTKPG